uniref:Uncharacterized protein n=1 Tax=Oryza brachyantha TaxID=4533 RepID=J3MTZ5_ORYBR
LESVYFNFIIPSECSIQIWYFYCSELKSLLTKYIRVNLYKLPNARQESKQTSIVRFRVDQGSSTLLVNVTSLHQQYTKQCLQILLLNSMAREEPQVDKEENVE